MYSSYWDTGNFNKSYLKHIVVYSYKTLLLF